MNIDSVVIDQANINYTTDTQKSDKGVEPSAPYFFVTNIRFETELEYFRDEFGLPVYYLEDGNYSVLGNLNPNLDNIRRLKALDMGLSFVSSIEGHVDLSKPESLYKFISLRKSI